MVRARRRVRHRARNARHELSGSDGPGEMPTVVFLNSFARFRDAVMDALAEPGWVGVTCEVPRELRFDPMKAELTSALSHFSLLRSSWGWMRHPAPGR